MADMTLTDLLEQVTRLGGDPSTTLIQVNGLLLNTEACEVGRESGALVVTLLTDDPEPVVTGALLSTERWEAWREAQDTKVPKVTRKARAGLADYLAHVLETM